MIISTGKVTAEKDDTLSVKSAEVWLKSQHESTKMADNTQIITVAKVTRDENGEKIIGPDTKAKSWRNIQEFETADSMTIEVLEA